MYQRSCIGFKVVQHKAGIEDNNSPTANVLTKRTMISPFIAHSGRKLNSSLSVICTTPKMSTIFYEGLTKYCLDEDRVQPEVVLPDEKRVNGYRSNIELRRE